MQLSRRSHREWRIFFWVSLAAAIISAWFGISVRPPGSSAASGAFTGVMTSLIIATPIVLFVLKGDRISFVRRLRRLPLAVYFLLQVAFYMVVILGGLMLARLLFVPAEAGPFAFRESIVFSIIMSVVGNLVVDVGRLLGFGTLRKLLTGRYVQPKREQRAFLLIDMKNSTGLAEQLGPMRFHELLNDFFRDIADAALECNAEIHKYVGDEEILTWSAEQALADGDCLACPFAVRALIEANRAQYMRRFGVVPQFRSAAHYGEIVGGEIGDVRREIAYVGDTLNVAARLLEAAKEVGHDVLVSTDMLERSALPPELKAEKLPTLAVRGRAAPLGIAALERA
jgi:adenylate cyclase